MLTSQGSSDNTDATVAPSPKRTSSDGKAQHSRVPRDVNSERWLKIPLWIRGSLVSIDGILYLPQSADLKRHGRFQILCRNHHAFDGDCLAHLRFGLAVRPFI